MLPRRVWLRLALLSGLPLALGGCHGYHFGLQSLYPAEICTVYVPVAESHSLRRYLGERLTEAVCKEIERRTPYKVVGDPNADSTLLLTVATENKKLLLNTLNSDPRELQVNLQVKVSWCDRRGRMLRQDQFVPLPPEVTDVQGSANLVPEMGQSLATQQQKAIVRVATQIVDLLENPAL